MTFLFAEHGHPGLLLFNGLCSFSCLAPSGTVQKSSGAHTKTQTTNTEQHVSRRTLTLSLTKPFIRQWDHYIYSSFKISLSPFIIVFFPTNHCNAVGRRQSGRMWICGSCCQIHASGGENQYCFQQLGEKMGIIQKKQLPNYMNH